MCILGMTILVYFVEKRMETQKTRGTENKLEDCPRNLGKVQDYGLKKGSAN